MTRSSSPAPFHPSVTRPVRWAQAGQFGVQFTDQFDLARLAPKAVDNGQPKVTGWHSSAARKAG